MSKRRAALPQGDQLLYRKPCLVENGAKSSDPKRLVVW